MKLTRKKEKVLEESINLIPMINIIFLLLIFFLLTGVVQKKNKLDIVIPESIHGVKSTLNKKSVIISIDDEGSYFFNDEKVSIRNFNKQILSNETNIIINIDQKTKINDLNKVFDLLKNNEVKKVHLNVREKSDDKN